MSIRDGWVKKVSLVAYNVCFLKTINYIEVQKYLFGTNGLSRLVEVVDDHDTNKP